MDSGLCQEGSPPDAVGPLDVGSRVVSYHEETSLPVLLDHDALDVLEHCSDGFAEIIFVEVEPVSFAMVL